MRIKNIWIDDDLYLSKDTMLPYLLKNNIENERLFQEVFIGMIIEDIDHPIEPLYRIFYEGLYLRQHNLNSLNEHFCSHYDKSENVFHLYASLSEMIGFVNMAAPPLIINMIKNQGYADLDEFVDVLRELLIEQAKNVPYYIMKFKECIGMNQFPTKTSYDFNRIDMLRQRNGHNSALVDIEAVFGSDIESLVKHDVNCVDLQCMINVYNKSQITNYVYDIIDELNLLEGDSIISIYKDPTRGYFIELYIGYGYDSKKYQNLTNLIRESYIKLYI